MNDKVVEFKRERMYGRVAKIPIANTLSELAEMDFEDYGDYATFLHIQDTSSLFSVAVFIGDKKMAKTAGMVSETAILHWLSVFGAPDILIVYKDMGCIG